MQRARDSSNRVAGVFGNLEVDIPIARVTVRVTAGISISDKLEVPVLAFAASKGTASRRYLEWR